MRVFCDMNSNKTKGYLKTFQVAFCHLRIFLIFGRWHSENNLRHRRQAFFYSVGTGGASSASRQRKVSSTTLKAAEERRLE